MLRRNSDQLAAMGAHFDRMYCMGGGSKSPLWLQIKASVTGCSMLPLRATESGCLGAALLAGVGAGLYPSIDEAAKDLVHVGDAIAPVAADREVYDASFARYVALYEALKPLFARE